MELFWFLMPLAVLILGFVVSILLHTPPKVRSVTEPDQRCPKCGTWQSDCGGWGWVGNEDNPHIDFAAECGACEHVSFWVWIAPGVYVPYQEHGGR